MFRFKERLIKKYISINIINDIINALFILQTMFDKITNCILVMKHYNFEPIYGDDLKLEILGKPDYMLRRNARRRDQPWHQSIRTMPRVVRHAPFL